MGTQARGRRAGMTGGVSVQILLQWTKPCICLSTLQEERLDSCFANIKLCKLFG